MINKDRVKAIVDEWLNGKDYFLTDLSISEDDRIVVEIDHREGVWIDDCVLLSKHIEERLNRDDEDYELEVGSAGLGQPFKVLRQYENHIGKKVETLTKDGRKYTGTLTQVNDEGFTLSVMEKIREEGMKRPKMMAREHTFRFEDVKQARYAIDFK